MPKRVVVVETTEERRALLNAQIHDRLIDLHSRWEGGLTSADEMMIEMIGLARLANEY